MERIVEENTRLKQELTEVKGFVKTIMEYIPHGVAIVRIDRSLRQAYANPAPFAISDLAPAGIVRNGTRDYDDNVRLHPDYISIVNQTCQKVFATGKEVICEFPCTAPHSAGCLQCRFVPEFSKDGTVETILMISHDMSALKRAQEEIQGDKHFLSVQIRENSVKLEHANRSLRTEVLRRRKIEQALKIEEARFEAFFKLSKMHEASVQQIASFVLEELTKMTKSKVGSLVLLDGNEIITSGYGWSRGLLEVCAIPERSMFTQIDGAGLWAQPIRERKPVIVNDYSASHPFKKGCPKGHIEIVRFLGIPAFDGDKIVALALLGNKEEDYDELDVQRVSSLLDGMWRLFERKRVEKTLQERAELLDLASDSILVRDLDDRIIFWNAGAETCYGWTKEEVLGQVSHTLFQTKFPKPLEEITEELFCDNRWKGELIHLTRSGKQIVAGSRWALLRDADGGARATLEINTDITDRKQMEKQLEEKSNRLQEVNAALKVLLKHRDEDRRDFEEALLTNIDNLILPYLRKMKSSGPNSTHTALIEILESHLMELTSAFGRTLALQYRVLTPTEMRVATLVREGKTSKEIADILCISEKTASFHRNNIRTKLGLRGARANLRSYLLSLA
jgi:PAS domain S-box-containing protein